MRNKSGRVSRDRGTNDDVESYWDDGWLLSSTHWRERYTQKKSKQSALVNEHQPVSVLYIKLYCPPFCCDIKFERRYFCNFFLSSFHALQHTQHTLLCEERFKARCEKIFIFFRKNFFRKHKARVEKRHLRHVYYYYLHSCHLRFHRREMGKRRKTFFLL